VKLLEYWRICLCCNQNILHWINICYIIDVSGFYSVSQGHNILSFILRRFNMSKPGEKCPMVLVSGNSHPELAQMIAEYDFQTLTYHWSDDNMLIRNRHWVYQYAQLPFSPTCVLYGYCMALWVCCYNSTIYKAVLYVIIEKEWNQAIICLHGADQTLQHDKLYLKTTVHRVQIVCMMYWMRHARNDLNQCLNYNCYISVSCQPIYVTAAVTEKQTEVTNHICIF